MSAGPPPSAGPAGSPIDLSSLKAVVTDETLTAQPEPLNRATDPGKLPYIYETPDQLTSRERRQIIQLRVISAAVIAIFVAFLIGFQSWLTVEVGAGRLNFESQPWFINLVQGSNFVEIVGLAVIVVKFLFPEPRRLPE